MYEELKISPPRPYRAWCNDFTLTAERTGKVFLTFDDGPDPDVTPLVLDLLAGADIRATFFCLGREAALYPDLVHRIVREGHDLGNHTHTHLSGWKAGSAEYLEDIRRCNAVFPSSLFRPPYGRFSKSLATALSGQFRICLWNLLSFDFDERKSPADCTRIITNNLKPGSVLVFHDRKPLGEKLEMMLPALFAELKIRGLETAVLSEA